MSRYLIFQLKFLLFTEMFISYFELRLNIIQGQLNIVFIFFHTFVHTTTIDSLKYIQVYI